MLHSHFYGLLTSVRDAFPHIRLILVGDFGQLLPVMDEWDGDYQSSAALHYLCDGKRFQLSICRRADLQLFQMCEDTDNVDIGRFPVTEMTRLNLAYTHATRIHVNELCMKVFGGETGQVIKASSEHNHSQDVRLCIGMPIMVYHTNKKAEEFNSEMWTVTELGEESFKMQRQILDVDVEQGLGVNDMPIHETLYDDFHIRCRPGYCITVHSAQGKTFKERYTIFDWNFKYMRGRGRYVATSRAQNCSQLQIVSRFEDFANVAMLEDEAWEGEGHEAKCSRLE